MKLGVCTDPGHIEAAAQAGFDYVECGLSDLAGMTEEAYGALLRQADRFPVPLSKCNCLLPGNVRVTGPEVDKAQLRAYLDRAFDRAAKLGIRLAVFGSGGARNVPEGFAFGAAWRQIAEFLQLAGEYGVAYGIDVAIEPLRRHECNILNYVSEGTAMAALVNHPHVGVLGDTFHMLVGHEPWEALSQAGGLLKHVHISRCLPDKSGRVYPAAHDGADYESVMQVLQAMGYAGDVSVEASTADLLADGVLAVERLKKAMAL